MTGNLAHQVEKLVREAISHLVTINVSARHVHITQEHLEILFGPGTQLTKLKDLMQPGDFAANEVVAVVGPNRRIFERVRILGPTRSKTQVELSFNDGRYIGLELPARVSGNLEGTAPIVLVGPKGAVQLQEGAIRALRHVHISAEDAAHLGLQNGQMCSIKTVGAMGVIFSHVLVRVGAKAILEMHIDTDEGNAAGLNSSAYGLLL